MVSFPERHNGEPLTAEELNSYLQAIEDLDAALSTLSQRNKLYFVEGTIATAAATAAKAVTISGYTPSSGDILRLTFTLGNTANSPTLSVNGGAAIPFRIGNAASTAVSMGIPAAGNALFYYDGTAFQQFGSVRTLDTNTTYALLTQAQAESTTDTTAGLVSGQRLAQANKTLYSPNVSGRLSVITPNDGLELGPLATANTPYIDFHSSGTSSDYDARIIASGGSATMGQGTIDLQSSGLTHNAVPILREIDMKKSLRKEKLAALFDQSITSGYEEVSAVSHGFGVSMGDETGLPSYNWVMGAPVFIDQNVTAYSLRLFVRRTTEPTASLKLGLYKHTSGNIVGGSYTLLEQSGDLSLYHASQLSTTLTYDFTDRVLTPGVYVLSLAVSWTTGVTGSVAQMRVCIPESPSSAYAGGLAFAPQPTPPQGTPPTFPNPVTLTSFSAVPGVVLRIRR